MCIKYVCSSFIFMIGERPDIACTNVRRRSSIVRDTPRIRPESVLTDALASARNTSPKRWGAVLVASRLVKDPVACKCLDCRVTVCCALWQRRLGMGFIFRSALSSFRASVSLMASGRRSFCAFRCLRRLTLFLPRARMQAGARGAHSTVKQGRRCSEAEEKGGQGGRGAKIGSHTERFLDTPVPRLSKCHCAGPTAGRALPLALA
ncbi:hypothetical protein L249_3503, partial [Ophiocordyceps polyrhachis-furcata BCC 54312]